MARAATEMETARAVMVTEMARVETEMEMGPEEMATEMEQVATATAEPAIEAMF
jgi:hypothetical protein